MKPRIRPSRTDAPITASNVQSSAFIESTANDRSPVAG